MKRVLSLLAVPALAVGLIGCQAGPGETSGTLIGAGTGALAGGIIGNNVSGISTGEGAVAGALIGGVVGNRIGNQQDQINDIKYRQQYGNQGSYYNPHDGRYYSAPPPPPGYYR